MSTDAQKVRIRDEQIKEVVVRAAEKKVAIEVSVEPMQLGSLQKPTTAQRLDSLTTGSVSRIRARIKPQGKEEPAKTIAYRVLGIAAADLREHGKIQGNTAAIINHNCPLIEFKVVGETAEHEPAAAAPLTRAGMVDKIAHETAQRLTKLHAARAQAHGPMTVTAEERYLFHLERIWAFALDRVDNSKGNAANAAQKAAKKQVGETDIARVLMLPWESIGPHAEAFLKELAGKSALPYMEDMRGKHLEGLHNKLRDKAGLTGVVAPKEPAAAAEAATPRADKKDITVQLGHALDAMVNLDPKKRNPDRAKRLAKVTTWLNSYTGDHAAKDARATLRAQILAREREEKMRGLGPDDAPPAIKEKRDVTAEEADFALRTNDVTLMTEASRLHVNSLEHDHYTPGATMMRIFGLRYYLDNTIPKE